MTAEYVQPKHGLEGELVCNNCGAHPISKNGSWVITRYCHECGARIEKKPSTLYEEERSRILYTCEEKYDGNMVAYVIDLESQMTQLKQEQDELIRCLGVKCIICKHADLDVDEGPCHVCDYTNGYKSFVWRGIQGQKEGDQA